MKFGALKIKALIVVAACCLIQVSVDGCSQDYRSPLLDIAIKPNPLLRSYAGNITFTCRILRRPGTSAPISRGQLSIKGGPANKTLRSTYCCQSGSAPFNVNLVIPYKDLAYESTLATCWARTESGGCSHVQKRLLCQDCKPNNKPSSTNGVPWYKKNVGLISLIVSAAVLLIIVVVVLLLCRKHKCGHHEVVDDKVVVPNFHNLHPVEESLPFPTAISDDDEYDRVIDINESMSLVISKEQLGGGKFGVVFLGQLKYRYENEDKRVAVKMLKDFENVKHKKDFEQEMRILTRLDHPNIVKLLAIHRTEDDFYIMMEYLSKGSLHNLLHVCKDALGTLQLIMFARDIACGMEYLASEKIVHRDLAARNVLIGDDDAARISDFGLARSIEETGQYITNQGYVPLKWVALETLEHSKFSVESDIWSYGIVLWEIFSYGEDPYHFMSHPAANIFDLRDFLKAGKRLDSPENCPVGVERLMKNCWSPFPEERPSFSSLRESTQSMVEELTNHVQVD